MNKQTQAERVLDYMRRFGSITALDAMRDLGIMRLASRITDLRREGHSVTRTMVEIKNRFGQKTRIACYALNETLPNCKCTDERDRRHL